MTLPMGFIQSKDLRGVIFGEFRLISYGGFFQRPLQWGLYLSLETFPPFAASDTVSVPFTRFLRCKFPPGELAIVNSRRSGGTLAVIPLA